MTAELVEAHAQLLSVAPLFDETTALDITRTFGSELSDTTAGSELSAEEVLRELRVSGLVTEIDGLWRIAEPLRGVLSNGLGREHPELYRNVAATFARHARNGLGARLVTTLGHPGASLQAEVFRAVGAEDGNFEELVDLVDRRVSVGRTADVEAVQRLLSQQPPSVGRDRTLAFLAGFKLWQNGEHADAVKQFEQVLRAPVLDRAAAIAGHLSGAYYSGAGEAAVALPLLRQAVVALRELQDDRGLVFTLTTLGRVEREVTSQAIGGGHDSANGEFADVGISSALACLEEAASISRRLGEPGLSTQPLVEVAITYSRLGQTDLAIEAAQEACSNAATGSSRAGARAWTVLGSLYKDIGDFDRCAEALDRAVELGAGSGPQTLELGRALNVLASFERLSEVTVHRAVEHAEQSVAIGRRLRNGDRHLSQALHTLAVCLIALRSRDRAIEGRILESFEESERLLVRLHDARGLAMLTRTRARFLVTLPVTEETIIQQADR